MKAVPTATLIAPWLVVSLRRGEGFPPLLIWLMIAAASLVGQLGGNISFQFALGQIGLALTVPLSLGGMIVGATILSRLFLHERLNLAAALAVGVLLLAIAVLSLGADAAREKLLLQATADPWQLALGVVTATMSGVAYSILNVVIRYSVQRGATLPATLLTVSVMGLISLSLLAWQRIGVAGMLQTSPRDLAMMMLAGVCNAVAFVALTRCLQLTSVIYANLLNAGQAALAALTGVIVFREPISAGLVGGVLLTVLGLSILTRVKESRTK
jgi:drug/metabolite transporter, DME family